MSHSPAKNHYYNEGRNGRHENGDHRYQNGDHGRGYQNGEHMPRTSYADRTYSLPRSVVQQQQMMQQQKPPGYYTQDRRSRNSHHSTSPSGPGAAAGGIDTPDFYFMPSQRKYSGEVVRVYVDYNKDPKN